MFGVCPPLVTVVVSDNILHSYDNSVTSGGSGERDSSSGHGETHVTSPAISIHDHEIWGYVQASDDDEYVRRRRSCHGWNRRLE